MRMTARWGLIAAVVLFLTGGAAAQPLDRDPVSYHILARQTANLKDYHLRGTGGVCNIGVNNVGGSLGTSAMGSRKFTMDVGQLVADSCSSASGDVAQCFCNAGGTKFTVPCAGWPPAVLADNSDAVFIAACNDGLAGGDYPGLFLTGGTNVSCAKNADCVPAAADLQPGNQKCDLAPGSYKTVSPATGCTVVMSGQYDVADWLSAKSVRFEVTGPTTLNVAGDTQELRFGDNSTLVSTCGQLRVNYRGPLAKPNDRVVNLGRAMDGPVTLDVCAPFALIRLRNDNQLRGHFFGNAIQSDFNNEGECCESSTACGCFDVVAPTTVAVGGTLALTGGCDLSTISAVKVCGVDCPIVLPRDPAKVECTVPLPPGVLPQSCAVEGVSSAGVFESNTKVTVTP
jgi:hypothetical protein